MPLKHKTKAFSCPLCNETEYIKIKTFSDDVIVGKCTSCGLSYTPKRHNTPEDLFGEISMDNLQMMYNPILDKGKKHFREKIFNEYLLKIKKYTAGLNHLDVGCAHGFFMDITRKDGFSVTGVEPNESMGSFGKKYLDLDIHHGTLDKVTLKDKWDVITFTDSLEYFKNPVGDLSSLINNNLNDSGVIFIKVPNGDYFYARHCLKQRIGLSLGGAEAYSPSKRVVHYNNKTLEKLAFSLGLEVLDKGYFLPINSPVWFKYVGLHLEIENPWWMGMKEKVVRKILHYLGLAEFLILGKNHFSQAVYIVAKKK
jgi:2-polyprenyl-3-methyl-5-hydroxy-6-metoxy-1,4-benzoquinol methylase